MYIEDLISHAHKALAICPNNANIYVHLGDLYTALREFKKASYYYIEAIKLKPAPSQAYYRLKFALQATTWLCSCSEPHLLEDGVLILQKVVQQNPAFHFAKVVLGELLTQQGQHEKAISYYKSASYHQTLASHPQLAKEAWKDNYSRQPDFLILGFPKCGTTSLYGYLASHPQILPAITKEVRYRSLSAGWSLDSYLAHFPCIADTNYLTFEATPSSATFPNLLRDISKYFPTIKLIVIVRNPVDRTISAFYHQRRSLKHQSSKLLESIIMNLLNSPDVLSDAFSFLKECLIDTPSKNELLELYRKQFNSKSLKEDENMVLFSMLGSCYIYYFKAWLHYFTREQVLILRSEDLFQHPEEVMERIYDFLGLSAYTVPEYRNFNPNSYPSITAPCRRQLSDWFHPYNQQLEFYLDMKFNW